MDMKLLSKQSLLTAINKYFLYIAIATVVIIVGVGANYILYPRWQEIHGTAVLKIDEKQQQLTEAKNFLRELENLRERYATVNYNDIQRLEHVLPHEFNMQKIYEQIADFASKADLQLNSITVKSPSAASTATTRRQEVPADSSSQVSVGSVQEVPVDFAITGTMSYAKFKEVITLLENEAPLYTLSSFVYPPTSSNVSFSVTTYYLSEL
jgi:cell division protein FtsL